MILHETRLPKNVCSTVYRFGSPCDQFYGYLVLLEGGYIYGYEHPNEKRWHYDSEGLAFISEGGTVTSRYHYEPTTNCFIGNVSGAKWPLCLIPVVRVDIGPNFDSLPQLIINTIPKSGTYFLEAAFAHAGWLPTRLHLGSHVIDDYRNLSNGEIHRSPEKNRINCPVDIFASTLPRGHLAVGHIENLEMISRIRKLGIPIINSIRNLRDVIVSLYHFKLSKVEPTDDPDRHWRKLNGSSAFDAFITLYSSRDMLFIANMTRAIISDSEAVIIRYEDLIQGRISQRLKEMFVDQSVCDRIGAGLLAKLNHDTPTLSKTVRSDWKSIWTPTAEDFFAKTGLLELNRKLGYEA